MIGFTAQRLMGLEVGEQRTGAARGERSLERLSATAIATGYGRRAPERWNCGSPKLRKGSYFPGFLEPRWLPEKALSAVVQ
jgi:putative transposase